MANIDKIKLPDNSEYNIQVKVVGATNGNVAVMDSNGNVADSGTGLADLVEINEKYGVKNLLPNKITSYGESSVTFTTNADGSLTVNGTASANINKDISGIIKLTAGNYKLTRGSDNSDFRLVVNAYNGTTFVRLLYYMAFTDDILLELDFADYDGIQITIEILSGAAFTNETFYLMIRDETEDSAYLPYAQTNRQLTVDKADASIIAPTEDGATASRAYATGEYFLRGGKLCICKTDIANGGTFTLNTNYLECTNLCSELRNKRVVRAREVTYATGVSGYGSEKVMCIEFSDGSILVNGAMKVSASYTSGETNYLLFTLPSGITFPHSTRQRWAVFNEFLSGNKAIPILFGDPGNTAKAWSSAVTLADLQDKNFIVDISW